MFQSRTSHAKWLLVITLANLSHPQIVVSVPRIDQTLQRRSTAEHITDPVPGPVTAAGDVYLEDIRPTFDPISSEEVTTAETDGVVTGSSSRPGEAFPADREAGGDVTIWVGCNFDYSYPTSSGRCTPLLKQLREVVSWQQLFQIGSAAVSYVVGTGIGRQVLHDPLAAAEGTLNFPVIVSHLTMIMTEAFLIDHVVYTWDPFAVAKLVEDVTIIGAAFSLLSFNGLSTLFSLKEFPNSVELISSYGGTALLHGGLLALHGVQAAVLKWNALTSFLKRQFILTQGFAKGDVSLFRRDAARTQQYLLDQGWTDNDQQVKLDDDLRDALQQSREMLRCLGAADPHQNVDLNRCTHLAMGKVSEIADFKTANGHSHGHGMAGLLTDIIAHGVALPTFFVAWLLAAIHLPVSALGVAWTAELSSLVLLACVIHSTIGDAKKVWKATGGEAPVGVTDELKSGIEADFKPTYRRYIQKVEFTTRKVTSQDKSLYYASFYVSVYKDVWKTFETTKAPGHGGGMTLKDEAAFALRKIAYDLKTYDFSRLDRASPNAEPFKMVYWLLSDSDSSVPSKRWSIHIRDSAAFAMELDHFFDESQVAFLLMQHLENIQNLTGLLSKEEQSTTTSLEGFVSPLNR